MSDLFRKKSMDRVNSPEQLNDYIRVSNPSVWMILAAIIILLAGVCVWGVFGHLDTEMETAGICRDGTLYCYISDADSSGLSDEILISVKGNEYSAAELSAFSMEKETIEEMALESGIEWGEEDWVLKAETSDLADGTYSVSVITKREKPISFVIN